MTDKVEMNMEFSSELDFDQKVIVFGNIVAETAKKVLDVEELEFCLLISTKEGDGKEKIALTTDIIAPKLIITLKEASERLEKALAMREKENMNPENIQ